MATFYWKMHRFPFSKAILTKRTTVKNIVLEMSGWYGSLTHVPLCGISTLVFCSHFSVVIQFPLAPYGVLSLLDQIRFQVWGFRYCGNFAIITAPSTRGELVCLNYILKDSIRYFKFQIIEHTCTTFYDIVDNDT